MKLTKDEIKLVVFILMALLVGASAKYYRSHHPPAAPVPAATPVARAAAKPRVVKPQ